MLKPVSDPAREQIIRTMIELTRPSSLHRIAVAGSESAEIDLELRRRGYFRSRRHSPVCHGRSIRLASSSVNIRFTPLKPR